MKIYRVVDNSEAVMITTDEVKALRLFRKIMEKYGVTWGWIDDEELI